MTKEDFETLKHYYNEHSFRFTPLNGKKPIRKGWQKEKPLSLAELQDHQGNIGLRTGQVSGGVGVIDIDDPPHAEKIIAGNDDRFPTNTVMSRTPRGGLHIYYRTHEPLKNKVGILPNVDVRGDGGQIVFPGSVNSATGAAYEWVDGHGPRDIKLAPLPKWVTARKKKRPAPRPAPAEAPPLQQGGNYNAYAEAALRRELETLIATVEPGRNHQLNTSAFNLGQLVAADALDEDAVVTQLTDTALLIGLEAHEIEKTIRSGFESGKAQPRDIPEPQNAANEFIECRAQLVGPNRPRPTAPNDPNFLFDIAPLRMAEHFQARKYTSNNGATTLCRHAGMWFGYNGFCYDYIDDEKLKAELYTHIDKCTTVERFSNGSPKILLETYEYKIKKLKPDKRIVAEVFGALTACDTLVDGTPPCWLIDNQPNPINLVALENCILDLATMQLHPSTPDFFTTNGLDYEYEPSPPPPLVWHQFLKDLWEDDEESIKALQEWFGYCLTPDTSQQKILLIIGPKRSGKSTIARVLTSVLGKSNVAAPTLTSMSTNFGLQPLVGKSLAIVSDARLSGRTDQSIVVERLLTISGEDMITIDRKYLSPVSDKLPTRLMLLTNELPRLTDSSGALTSRFIVLEMEKTFYGNENLSLLSELEAEIPSIFPWAVEGWKSLRQRGHFQQPRGSQELIREFEDLGSPVSAFLRERCEVGPGMRVPTTELFDKWKKWCNEVGRTHPGTSQVFGRDLRSAIPGLRTPQIRGLGGVRVRAYEGVGIRANT